MHSSKREYIMEKNYTYLANWKMNFTIEESLSFFSDHYDNFILLSKKAENLITICPSAETLHPLAQMLQGTNIELGAQDCSDVLKGPFTGQVSPLSLKQVGCSFCIIGHSEQRALGVDTNERIATKCSMLLSSEIIPVICIGENSDDYNQGLTLEKLKSQLSPIFDMLKNNTHFSTPIVLAYEPVWAIGTGKVATPDHIESVLAWLAQQTVTQTSSSYKWKFLYGGSIKASNCATLKAIPQLDGFLIGGASLDFEEFEKIVNYR